MNEQIDTSTDEGYKSVCERYWSGGEIERLNDSKKWCMSTLSPRYWDNLRIRRIKQKRTPQVGDVWEISINSDLEMKVLLIKKNTDINGVTCFRALGIDGAAMTFYSVEFLKYLGKIDLSLLMDGE